jgi:hypothetical protein
MQVLMVTHKPLRRGRDDAYLTDGGFPYQMMALAPLFDRLTIAAPVVGGAEISGLTAIRGPNIVVAPLPLPRHVGWRRKIQMAWWVPRNLPRLVRLMRGVDAVHVAVPGDIGFVGLALALILGKRVFARHCGTWGHSATVADRLLMRLLRRIATGRAVVFATGGGSSPPDPGVSWIFSTTLSERELGKMTGATAWDGMSPLRLAVVARLDAPKNVRAAIEGLSLLGQSLSTSTLEVIGDGPERGPLEALAAQRGVRERVRFHGNVSHADVLRILSSCHLFVFPTRVAEGFPKAVLEALACGLPVIAPPVSVIPDLLGDGAGLLLPETTAEAVRTGIDRLTSDPDALAAMARRTRPVAARFTLEAWRERIGERLEERWGPLRWPREASVDGSATS